MLVSQSNAADQAFLDSYYQLDPTKPLRYALHDLIDEHTLLVYDNNWDPIRNLDEDPDNQNNIILIYSGNSIPKQDTFTREHIIPQSYGFVETNPAYSDLHNLRAAMKSLNSSRLNKLYDQSDPADRNYRTPAHVDAPGSSSDTNSWEPPAEVRGDVARAAFYMATRYVGDEPREPNLILTDNLSIAVVGSTYFGKLSTLLQWHKDDPPDDFERRRNDLIFENYQGNRNPYIDRPEYVDQVFNDQSDPDNDGLTTFDEVFTYQTDPTKADTNGDGISDGQMVQSGISPTVNLSPLFESIVQDTKFRAGGIVVERVGDNFQIKLTIEKSDDLKTWETHLEQTILIEAEEGKQFLRVKAE